MAINAKSGSFSGKCFACAWLVQVTRRFTENRSVTQRFFYENARGARWIKVIVKYTFNREQKNSCIMLGFTHDCKF
jgi:hypothetical protein